jgi:hypothetical protein
LEFSLKHKTIILRSAGAFMLLIGFVAYFWITPKEGISANALAAANVARMEAKVAGSSSRKSGETKSDAKFLEKLKETQANQLKYLTIDDDIWCWIFRI